MLPPYYILPSDPSFHVEDRFSILNCDEPTVPFWNLLSALLDQEICSPKALIDLLETLAVVLRDTANADYGLLRLCLDQNITEGFWTATWPILKRLALDMPILFPTNSIPILSKEEPRLVLSRAQTACLVVHQFLCTLVDVPWQQGFHDFDLWYGMQQPHPSAVKAYLTALLTYFQRLAWLSDLNPTGYTIDEWPIVYELTEDDLGFDRDMATSPLRDMKILRLPEAITAPDVLGLPDGAAVISANKYIGFGCTGTQEETHTGASPEACPAVLVTPPLKDSQVLIVTGAEAMITIRGYGRDARCADILQIIEDRVVHRKQWTTRTMIFMDALELDTADRSLGVPVDLQPGNVERDLKKAYIGFKHKCKKPLIKDAPNIFTGFWGCGAFGGDPQIKACIQWCAASLAGCNLTLICSTEEQHRFSDSFEMFISRLHRRNVSVSDFKSVLIDLLPGDISLDHTPLMKIEDRLIPTFV